MVLTAEGWVSFNSFPVASRYVWLAAQYDGSFLTFNSFPVASDDTH